MTRATAGYRPMPNDFAEAYVRVGYEGIRDEMRCYRKCIPRWINEYDEAAIAEGRPLLAELRHQHLVRHYAEHHGGRRVPGRPPNRAKRYVLGRTLSAVNSGTTKRVED